MKTYLNLLVVMAIFLGLQSCTNNEPVEISQWRGPNRDGIYPAKDLLKEWPQDGAELAWSYDKLGIGYSSAAVTSDKVYINGIIDSVGNLFAFSHEGDLLWKKEYGPEWTVNFPGTRTTPLIYGKHIYLLSGYGDVYCLLSENGEQVWTKNILKEYGGVNPEQGITENLVVDGDKLYCAPGGPEHNVIALNRMNGQLIWSSKGMGEKSAFCSPGLIEHNGNKFYITMTDSSLISIDATNGKVAWRYGDLIYTYPDHPNTPVYKDGSLFAIDGGPGGSVKLKLSDDGYSYEVEWTSSIVDQVMGSAVLVDNKIYSYSKSEKKWSAIDWNSGEIVTSLDTLTEGSIIYADGMLYCYTFNGHLALMKASANALELVSSFKTVGERRDHWAHPVIYGKKLFVRYHDNFLVYNI